MNIIHSSLLGFAGLCLSSLALATNGLFPAGNGVIAHGMGGAGIANATEAMSAVDNPALLSRVQNQWGLNLHFYKPTLSASIANNYVKSETDFTVTPQAAFTHNLNEQIDLGLLINILGGAGTDYPATLLGERAGITAGGIIIAPSASYQINQASSLGLSLQLAYESIETDGFNPALGGFGNNEGSATGYGFKLGYVIDVLSHTSIGLTYQSIIDVDEIDEQCSGDGMFTLYKASGGDCSLDMPEIYGLGVAHQLNDSIRLVADIQQINWESVDVIKDIFGWENRLVYKLGGQYTVNDQLALRIGFNHSAAPAADNRVADNIFTGAVVEDHYTLGASYQITPAFLLSGYYTYGAENEVKQQGAVSQPTLSPLSKLKMSEHIVGISVESTF